MSRGQFKAYGHHERTSGKKNVTRKGRGMNHFGENSPIPELTIANIIRKLFSGLNRLAVALKYQFHKNTNIESPKSSWSFPWFKVGLIGIAIFLFTQKDFQFSFNMKAPSEQSELGIEPTGTTNQEMNVAQAVSLRNTKMPVASAKDFDSQKVNTYIRRFGKVAKMEMKKFGIPASIKMAWAIAESHAGQSNTAVQNNNHFGTIMEGHPFTTSWENWRAHSILLHENYADLFQSGTSYRKWAKAINKQSIPGRKKLGNQLIQIIETYQLNRLDEDML